MTTQEKTKRVYANLLKASLQLLELDQEIDYLKDQLATFNDIDIAIEIVKAHGYKVSKGSEQ